MIPAVDVNMVVLVLVCGAGLLLLVTFLRMTWPLSAETFSTTDSSKIEGCRFRVLDEIAAAFWTFGRFPRVVSSLELADNFPRLTPGIWDRFAAEWDCPLPQLEPTDEGWTFPAECETVESLARHVARFRCDWMPPASVTVHDWREAQIFAGVRKVTVECLCVPKEAVVREARFVEDLGAD
jgi:hypothetical protein